MIYGYCRVSTKGQALYGNSLEEQKQQILSQYPNAEIIVEAYTAYKDKRPLFDELISKAVDGDVIVVTKLDRFCRSVTKGVPTLNVLYDKGVKLHILNMGIIENTPIGNLLFNVLQSFAQFERDMIVERTTNGKEIARMNPDYKEGKPRLEVDSVLFENVYYTWKSGNITAVEAMSQLGLKPNTFYRRVGDFERARGIM